jgi:hypothetical protein
LPVLPVCRRLPIKLRLRTEANQFEAVGKARQIA